MEYRAMNGFVLVERHERLSGLGGVMVSEGARVANHVGTVVSSIDGALDGEIVHIPYNAIEDYKVGGREYVAIDEKDLFARRGSDGGWVPMNGYAIVRKGVNDHIRGDSGDVLIHMTDEYIETTNWVEIIAIAKDCKYLDESDIGKFCISPETNNKLQRLDFSKDFCIHEELIEFTAEA